MASEEESSSSSPSQVVVHGNGVWYCINLESLPGPEEKLLPIAHIAAGGWALIGDRIYAAGGNMYGLRRQPTVYGNFNCVASYQSYFSKGLYKRNIMDNSTSPWEIESSSRKYQRHSSCLVPFDDNKKIFIMSSIIQPRGIDDEESETIYGEIYDLETKTWSLTPCNLLNLAHLFLCCDHAFVVDNQTILFYSVESGRILFYHHKHNSYRVQLHPHLALYSHPNAPLPKGLVHGTSLDMLITSVTRVKPVLIDSTLYWFAYDLRLYGYDFVKVRWFQSPPLKEEQLWEPLDAYSAPVLVHLCNEQVLLFHCLESGKLGMLYLALSKGTDSLSVSVGSSHIFSPDPCFVPEDGKAIMNQNRYVASAEKSAIGKKSEDNEQPQPKLQTPVLKQELKEVDSPKDEVSKLKLKQLQLLGKDHNAMGLNELRLLERQLNEGIFQLHEGLLVIKDKKEELLIQQLEHSRRQLDELLGLSPLPPFKLMHPVLKEGEKGLDSDTACEGDRTLQLGLPIMLSRKRKEPEMGCDSSNSENQVGSK